MPLGAVPLDKNGLKQKPDDIPIYIVYRGYSRAPYAALKLPPLP
jgi:hypothetical protein